MDYRDIPKIGRRFDRVVSVGMVEHVGRGNYQLFMDCAKQALKPVGLFLLHFISSLKEHEGDPWIKKYIFPGGVVPSLRESDRKNDERIYYYLDEELDMADIKIVVRGLKAESFTEESPDGKEEISLTVYLDNENHPETTIQLNRYNGEKCIAVVDGKPVAFVERASVVDLVEAVNGVVLK